MDHQKQIRDSLEKHNQLVKFIIFRFFQDPIQNIPYAQFVKSHIKIIIFTLVPNNIEKKYSLVLTTIILNNSATYISNYGTDAKTKLMKKLKDLLK